MLWLLFAATMVEGADIQLMPASLRAMETDLALSPARLAVLAICQGVACALFGPFWANLADSGCPRSWLLAAGCATWGLCTLALACVSDLTTMAVLRTLNGASLAMLLPVTQAHVAEVTRSSERGYLFGLLSFFFNIGQVLVCLMVTPISRQLVFGYHGWRVALAVIACMSICLSPCFVFFAEEQPRAWKPELFGPIAEMKKFLGFLRINTFCVIGVQGLFGTIPGAALTFATMYFQYMGITDLQAGLLFGVYIVGSACGGFFGGWLGDYLNARSPEHGRPLTAQLSLVASMPFIYMIFMEVPREASNYRVFMVLLWGLGFVSSWSPTGCTRPVLSEIVCSEHRASALAWEVALERSSGSLFGPALVAILAETQFGYEMSIAPVSEMPQDLRVGNTHALGEALFISTMVPWAICFLLFGMLHSTYFHDAVAQVDARLRADDEECGPMKQK